MKWINQFLPLLPVCFGCCCCLAGAWLARARNGWNEFIFVLWVLSWNEFMRPHEIIIECPSQHFFPLSWSCLFITSVSSLLTRVLMCLLSGFRVGSEFRLRMDSITPMNYSLATMKVSRSCLTHSHPYPSGVAPQTSPFLAASSFQLIFIHAMRGRKCGARRSKLKRPRRAHTAKVQLIFCTWRQRERANGAGTNKKKNIYERRKWLKFQKMFIWWVVCDVTNSFKLSVFFPWNVNQKRSD